MPELAKHFQPEQFQSWLQAVADSQCKSKLVGIALGVIHGEHQYCACSGWADTAQQAPITLSTNFEVGSLSKLFTSLLLAVAVRRGEIELDEPVQTALRDAVALPTDGASDITYRSLSNHRSSLPRLPRNLLSKANMKNPYVHFGQEQLYASLSSMKKLARIGSRQEYSNFGVGLLGHVLGKIAESDYRKALEDRVLVPLQMNTTTTCSDSVPTVPLATSHKRKGKPTPHWDFTDAMVAAGGVRSSLSDMLYFLKANTTPSQSPLQDAIQLMREPSDLPDNGGKPRSGIALGAAVFVVVSFATLFAIVLTIPQGLANLFGEVDLSALFNFQLCFGVLAATMAAAIRWGHGGGFYALLISMLLASVWTYDLDWITLAFFGMCHIYVGSTLSRPQIDGEGRLAWLTTTVGSHPVMWHNGLVGGAASFIAVIEEQQMGVVVLTNTARTVDHVGIKVLKELLNRRDEVGISDDPT